ncbi:hypothetical protein BKP64_06350 [Marinobacter salinus]|uniref:Restriction endonuclease n=1 Tax=Marinobacter salinus TaxID=1874317 RepID=A0A1D9GJW3_9GAMM|nr:Eco29kI family restriction endonuclease [Marinobacter salinus]AOY87824.1 hypothetical protein BKP64_06350 [Marinobacter salinus]
MSGSSHPFDPLNKKNLAESIGQAILSSSPVRLDQLERFNGAGLYLIYYCGTFDAYADLGALNSPQKLVCPIYVGKADPQGKRKGVTDELSAKGTPLYSRLTKHAGSIKEATNLQIEDFFCKYLVVEDIWIPLGEALLISKFMPVWNRYLDGFGNNDPGRGRYGQVRSRWDVLHPGREWATRCKDRGETLEQVAHDVKFHIKHSVIPAVLQPPETEQGVLNLGS